MRGAKFEQIGRSSASTAQRRTKAWQRALKRLPKADVEATCNANRLT